MNTFEKLIKSEREIPDEVIRLQVSDGIGVRGVSRIRSKPTKISLLLNEDTKLGAARREWLESNAQRIARELRERDGTLW